MGSTKAGVSYLIHYLDDYLTMGPPLSQICQHNVGIFISLCEGLGILLAIDKLEGPATSLSFLVSYLSYGDQIASR